MLHRIAALGVRFGLIACRLRGLARSETGATAIEYGLMLAGVALFIMITVFAMGDALDNLFTSVQTKFANAYS